MGYVIDELVSEVVRATGADPRSVIKRLAGLPVRGAAGRCVDVALASVAERLAVELPEACLRTTATRPR